MLYTILSFAFEAAAALGALMLVAGIGAIVIGGIAAPFVGLFLAVRDSFKPRKAEVMTWEVLDIPGAV